MDISVVTYSFLGWQMLCPLSPLPKLHIFGNTNFGILNEFQVVVSVIANPLPALPCSCFVSLLHISVHLRVR